MPRRGCSKACALLPCPKSPMPPPFANQACATPTPTPELCEPLISRARTMLADALAAKVEGLRSNASRLEERARASERCCAGNTGTPG